MSITLHPDVAVYRDQQLRIGIANGFPKRHDPDNEWPLRILWTDKERFNLNGNVITKTLSPLDRNES